MDWIESKGGPLALVPEARLTEWSGVKGGDYERACDMPDEIGVVPSAAGDVLILGDEPHRTAWLPRESGGVLVRWIYADSERSVSAALRDAEKRTSIEDAGITMPMGGAYRLIDAADRGDKLSSGSIAVHLQSGDYRIETGICDAGPEVRLLLHRLKRIG